MHLRPLGSYGDSPVIDDANREGAMDLLLERKFCTCAAAWGPGDLGTLHMFDVHGAICTGLRVLCAMLRNELMVTGGTMRLEWSGGKDVRSH